MSEHFKAYLGDAVYASMTNWGDIVLTTEDGIRATNRIVLEPAVARSFDEWRQGAARAGVAPGHDMNDRETAAHIRRRILEPRDLFSWVTDGAGYAQHMRFVRWRNESWHGKGSWENFVLNYADRLEAGEIPPYPGGSETDAILQRGGDPDCAECREIGTGMGPSHRGSPRCESGSLASGGDKTHCSCSVCF